jgi:hypothetical protein
MLTLADRLAFIWDPPPVPEIAEIPVTRAVSSSPLRYFPG